MALDLCIETYGSLAPLISTDSAGAVLRLNGLPRRRRRPAPAHGPSVDFSRAVIAAADRLPFVLAHALWLIEICRCTYAQAAVELATTPHVVEERVSAARRAIRQEILDKPPGRDVGPMWDRPPG